MINFRSLLVMSAVAAAQFCEAAPAAPQKSPAPANTPAPTPIPLGGVVAAPGGATTEAVLGKLKETAAGTNFFRADIYVSEMVTKKGKPDQLKVQLGTVEFARGAGARMKLTRKDRSKELIANPERLWEYDIEKKRAKYISPKIPILAGLAEKAFQLNLSLLTDETSLKLKGVQTVAGVPCYRLEGSTPGKYSIFGLKSQPIIFHLRVDNLLPTRIELPKSKELVIQLTKQVANAPISKERFDFSPPAGTKVEPVLGW